MNTGWHYDARVVLLCAIIFVSHQSIIMEYVKLVWR